MGPIDPLPLSGRAYATLTEFKANFNITEDTDDEIIGQKLVNATNSFERVTGRTFAQVEMVDQIIRKPNVLMSRDGVLLVRVKTPRITQVDALAYRTGTPAAPWLGVDTGLLDWDEEGDTVRAYISGSGPYNGALWAKMSYTAGWLGDDSDPYPGDIVECILWWANWLYRTKDVPMEKTANPMLGTVTIPSAMPSRLKVVAERWKVPMVV